MGVSTPGREYMSLRGYMPNVNQYKRGTKAMMATLELRTPAAPISVLESLKIFKIGMPSIVFFTDIGNAWTKVFDLNKSVATTGAEIRLSLNLISEPLFIFSYGWAESWAGTNKPESYLQLSLVNPF